MTYRRPRRALRRGLRGPGQPVRCSRARSSGGSRTRAARVRAALARVASWSHKAVGRGLVRGLNPHDRRLHRCRRRCGSRAQRNRSEPYPIAGVLLPVVQRKFLGSGKGRLSARGSLLERRHAIMRARSLTRSTPGSTASSCPGRAADQQPAARGADEGRTGSRLQARGDLPGSGLHRRPLPVTRVAADFELFSAPLRTRPGLSTCSPSPC